jgi:membrane protease YdiL (CAAX protease family)
MCSIAFERTCIFRFYRLFNLKLSDFISLAFSYILINLIKNIFEEFSWRGYLTPKLIDLNINDWLVYIIFG